MEMRDISSSHLKSCGYDPDESALHILFKNGATYKYKGVSSRQFDALMASKSKGEHFHQHIRPHHSHEKL
jgi:hypothetical protein